MIPKSEWQWFGNSAHLIVGQDCRFHLATRIGDYLISTVGEYLPDAPVREIMAESRGISLKGRGDERRADYMDKIGYQEIGCYRTYETLVFKLGPGECECGCGLPVPDEWSELDAGSYNDAKSARAGHMELCEKWASHTEPVVTASL